MSREEAIHPGARVKEALVDIAILIYVFISNLYITAGSGLYTRLSPFAVVALFTFITFVMPVSMSMHLARYNFSAGERLKKAAKIITAVTGFFIFVLFISVSVSMVNKNPAFKDYPMTAVAWPILASFTGVALFIAGYVAADRRLGGRRGSMDYDDPLIITLGIAGAIAAIFPVLCYLVVKVENMGEFKKMLYSSLVVIIPAVVFFIIYYALRGIGTCLEKRSLLLPLSRTAGAFVPLFVVSALLLWNEAVLHFFRNIVEIESPVNLVIGLWFTGLIPYRLLLALCPPVSRGNVFLGAISLASYLFTVTGVSQHNL